MARRLLCLVLVLVLGLVATYTKGAATNDDVDETAKLEKLTEEMLQMKEKEKRELGEDEKLLTHEFQVRSSVFEQIEELAERLIPSCNRSVNLANRQSRRSAFRRHYNVFQDGGVNFMREEVYGRVKRSEECSACVLDLLCKNASIQSLLRIPSQLPPARRERICAFRIISLNRRANPRNPNFETPECDPDAEFRTIDGTCNNLANPEFGAHDTEFLRLVVPQYADGISAPRISVTGHPLPNARLVSKVVHGSNADRTNPNSKVLTHLTMNFAQFLDHDVTLAEEQGINCEPPTRNPECINIDIPAGDSTFLDRGVTFVELERNAPAEQESFCGLIPRGHVNEITAYVDGSNVYGSTDDIAESLRTSDGLLKVMKHPFSCDLKKLLPAQPPELFCESLDQNKRCFLSGDIRNNENPGLNSVHTIFVRQHNRIASFFVKNTNWDGERIYQVTRKIVGAQLQIITYGEFLTLVLSQENIDKCGLRLLKGKQFFTGYDKTVNAQMTAAFSVAAYRFGHTLIQEEFIRLSQGQFEHRCDKCHGGNQKFLPIAVLDFGNPTYLYDVLSGGIDSILTGLMKQPAGKLDKKVSSSVQENLRRGEGDLSDLVAINIERGRERGVASYTTYRNLRLCGLPRVTSFDQLETVAGFLKVDVINLKRVFKNVWDIDLFTGGLCEPAIGGLLGPTFQCIIGNQFKRLRIGDRFWHENAPNPQLNTTKTAFTACQLQEVRKTSMSEIVAANSDGITSVPRNAFQQSEVRIPLSMLPKVDLRAWLDDFDCPHSVVSSDEENTEW